MKLKSSSSAKKRFKVTGTGKYRQQKSAKNHLLTNKSKRQKRLHPLSMQVDDTQKKRLRKLIPYA